jgi:hypothetical protein
MPYLNQRPPPSLGTYHDPGFITLEELRSAVIQCLQLQHGPQISMENVTVVPPVDSAAGY